MVLFLGSSFIFGAIIGSFLNVLTLRLPRGRSVGGRSACPSCSHVLAAQDLVPILSYVFLRGRCRYCRSTISPRYVLVEILTGVAFCVVTYLNAPQQPSDLFLLAFWHVVVAVSIVTFIVDLEQYIILDMVTGVGSVLALAFLVTDALVHGSSLYPLLISRAAGIVCGFLFFWLLWKFSGGRLLGFGDVKFTLFMGIVLGFPLIVPGLLFSFWFGALYAIPLLLTGTKGLKSKIPFGTFLVPGMLVASVVGQRVLNWYGAVTGLW